MTEPDTDPRLSEVELYRTPDDIPPAPRKRPLRWMIPVGVLVVLAIVASVVIDRRAADAPVAMPTPNAAAPVADTAPPDARSLGGLPEPVVVPPLNDSDRLVRDLVRRLTSNPSVAALLATDNLIRMFTTAVSNIANGRTPAAQLRVLRPATRFKAIESGEDLYVDPASFSRYDSTAAALESVDPAGAARLYATLKPRIDEAYRELGPASDATFDATLEQAIVHLLQTPTPPREVAVARQRNGVLFGYADPRLERLSPAQRQFLRMGPTNVRRIKGSLRQLALALGIPASHLPAVS